MKALELTGQRFGILSVLERADKQAGHYRWLCECKCGNQTIVQGRALKSGQIQSCGCARLSIWSAPPLIDLINNPTEPIPSKIERAMTKSKQDYNAWYRDKNKATINERHKVRRNAKCAWFKAYKETLSCQECGEDDAVCLDLHHRNPAEKRFQFSKSFFSRSIQAILDELAKCDVLCANCHRKLHAMAAAGSEAD